MLGILSLGGGGLGPIFGGGGLGSDLNSEAGGAFTGALASELKIPPGPVMDSVLSSPCGELGTGLDEERGG